MTADLQPFRLEAIETLAQTIGDYFTGFEITRLFKRSGYPQLVHDQTTK
jgi:hypothetical protein